MLAAYSNSIERNNEIIITWFSYCVIDRFRQLNSPSIFLILFRLTIIIHEGENFAFPKLYSENLAGNARHPCGICNHPSAMSYPYFWKCSEQTVTWKWNYTAAINFLKNVLSLSLGTICTFRKRKISASLVS